MARVNVYDNCNDIVAHLRGVRGEVVHEAGKHAAIARGYLLAHRAEGKSTITMTRGTKLVDAYVNLEDEPSKSSQGLSRAHIIEFGREGARAVAPLQRAFGINIRG
jgi:hypothetical protein